MRPSILYYKLVRLIYAVGLRPKHGTLFYSKVVEDELVLMGKLRLW